jgi:ankyrin repeat protein
MGSICSVQKPSGLRTNSSIYSMIEAAAIGDVVQLGKILSKDNIVNLCDASGRTALHLACAEGRVEVFDLLIRFRAKIDAHDRLGNEPLQEAILNNHKDIVQLLLNAGATLSTEALSEMESKLLQLTVEGELDPISHMIESRISPCCVDYSGKSPMHLAAERGHHHILQYLIALQVDVNCIDVSGATPLMIAMQRNDVLLGDMLLKAGAVPRSSQRQKLSNSASFAIMQACPGPIAIATLEGRTAEPITRNMASLFFSDVVGFTALSSTLPASKVARMLHALFRRMDRLAHEHGVQKVDVMGDAYIAATNFTEEQPDNHAARLARFAIAVVAAAQAIPVDEDDPARGNLQARTRQSWHASRAPRARAEPTGAPAHGRQPCARDRPPPASFCKLNSLAGTQARGHGRAAALPPLWRLRLPERA